MEHQHSSLDNSLFWLDHFQWLCQSLPEGYHHELSIIISHWPWLATLHHHKVQYHFTTKKRRQNEIMKRNVIERDWSSKLSSTQILGGWWFSWLLCLRNYQVNPYGSEFKTMEMIKNFDIYWSGWSSSIQLLLDESGSESSRESIFNHFQ